MAALLAHARAKLEAARILLAARAPGDAASRAYYAAFHAVSAVLVARGQAYSSHAQVLGAFNRDFVHPGTFPREFTASWPVSSKIARRATTIPPRVWTLPKPSATSRTPSKLWKRSRSI